MLQSRLPRPDELGSRFDTPMREESRPAQGPKKSLSHLNGLPTPSSLLSTPQEPTPEGPTIKSTYKMHHQSPAPGFTAVNGDAQRKSSFRPDDAAQRSLSTSQVESSKISTDASGGPHQVPNWRPDERSTVKPSGPQSPNPNKRRRTESGRAEVSPSTGDDGPIPEEDGTSKQRAPALDAPASATSTSPEQSAAHATSETPRERKIAGRYEREPSPIFMKDRGAPPPPPRPEVAAGLAESLQRELASAQDSRSYVSPATQNSQKNVSTAAQDSRQQVSPTGERKSPVDETYDREQSPPSDSEVGPAGDADEPTGKKRKRNFSNRTKTGCHTCRARKKKCDENKPVCHNCQRGQFDCGGYGPKPPGGTKVSAARPLTAIKPAYEPSHGPSQFSLGPYYDNRPRPSQPPYDPSGYGQPPPPRPDSHGLPSVHHYNHAHVPPPAEYRPRAYGMQHPEPPPHYPERFPPHGLPPPPPPAEYGVLAPYRVYPDPTHPAHHHNSTAPPAPPASNSLPRYAPMDQYHGPPGPPTTISSKDSGISSHSNSHRSRPGLVYRSGEKIHRSKMITGEPCSYFTDKSLINERSSCKEVLERYNDADKTTSGVHMDQKGVIFSQLVNPKERGDYGHSWDGPIGSIGDRVVVQAPFSCEYGYNLHFGDETMIMRNCNFQDAATVSIGSHVTIGPSCNFLTLVSPPSAGPHGLHSTGAIRVEDGCTIGGNVTILPFRTIGKGATVVAGSVVTKDVKPNSTVAGNPAKPVRDDDTEVIEKENAKVLKEMQNDTWRRERYA